MQSNLKTSKKREAGEFSSVGLSALFSEKIKANKIIVHIVHNKIDSAQQRLVSNYTRFATKEHNRCPIHRLTIFF